MDIVEDKQEKPWDTSVVLDSLNGGDAFHFSSVDFQSALLERAIYIVSSKKDGRVEIFNPYDGLKLLRDGCHKVDRVDAKLKVKEREF